MLRKFLPLALAPMTLLAAFNQKTAWDVQTAGNDTNGGGFNMAASGTNYSDGSRATKRSAANGDTADLSVADAVTTAASATVTSAEANFTPAIVGNTIYLSGGSGALPAGRYQVTARASATSVTVDRPIPISSTGVTMNIGGSLATLTAAFSQFPAANGGVADMAIFLKYSPTPYMWQANIATNGFASPSLRYNRLAGYKTTHEDAPGGADRPLIQAGGAITLFTQNLYSDGWVWENLILDGAGAGFTAFNATQGYPRISNCKFMNWSSIPVSLYDSTAATFVGNEVTGTAGSSGIVSVSAGLVAYNWLHDNTITNSAVIFIKMGSTALRNLITNNMGANTDGIRCGNYVCGVVGNTIYRVSRYGFIQNPAIMSILFDNLFACTATAIAQNADFGGSYAWPGGASTVLRRNGFWSNAANYNSGVTTTGDAALFGSGCSGNGPFVNAATSGAGDWSLNGAAGAIMRNVGAPGVLPGIMAGAPLDIGAAQHADLASSGGGQTAYPFLQ